MGLQVETVGACAGAAVAAFGGVTLLISKDESTRKKALLAIAGGVAAVAVCLGKSWHVPQSVQEAVNDQVRIVVTDEGVRNCSISKLEQLLEFGTKGSITSRVFSLVNETDGISCENFLPWQDRFYAGVSGYIDGISASVMNKAVQWGIDPAMRPFVAIKSLCNDAHVGAVAIFQRYTGPGNLMVAGGHFQGPQDCFPNLGETLYPPSQGFFEKFTTLLEGRQLVAKVRDMTSYFTLAPKGT